MKAIISFVAFLIALVVIVIILVPETVVERWYWDTDYTNHADSVYYQYRLFDNNTEETTRYCVARNDTLFVLQVYGGEQIDKFYAVVYVYRMTNNTDGWDWFSLTSPEGLLNPANVLSPLNPVND